MRLVVKYIGLTAVLVLMLSACHQEDKGKNNQPNIILIYSDDVGYGDLSLNGCEEIHTQYIDAIANEGVNFVNGYVTSPICGPSRAGLLTGKYQQRFGITENHMVVPISEKLLPEYLKEAGYKTALFGKWHLTGMKGCFDTLLDKGHHPMDRGFDEFYGFYGCQASYFNADRRLFDNKDSVKSASYLTDVLGQKTSDFVKANKESPFFVYLAFNATHTPMEVGDDYLSKFAHIEDSTRRVYLAMLKCMDDAVGEIMKTLHDEGLSENTMVFFINDNGGKVTTGSSNLPLRGRKYGVFDGGVKVPFMLKWPSGIPSGVVSKSVVSTMDVLPTILNVTGVENDHADGVNLLDYIESKQLGNAHEYLFWKSEYSQGNNWKAKKNVNRRDWSAVRKGKWKMHQFLNLETNQYKYELFDLSKDEGELHDVSAQYADTLNTLKTALSNWAKEMNYKPFPVKLKH